MFYLLKIIIGADVVPTDSNKNYFIYKDIDKIVDRDLKRILDLSDFRVFNLEVPLTDKISPILKCGPNLISPKETVNGIKELGVDLLTLANNHIMDQGVNGLKSTTDVLSSFGIAYLGAGMNLKEASKPYFIEKEGIRVGLYACAEHEFSIATNNRPGANPYEPLDSFDHVKELKEKCDYVIVLFHGGKEHYRYPSPYLQRIFRKFADYGADLVIAQHTHCVGCKEEYNGSTLVYGQGNFLFDIADNEYWNTAILIEVTINNKNEYDLRYIPLSKNNCGVKLGYNDEKILLGFNARSKEIEDDSFIFEQYKKLAYDAYKTYLSRMAGRLVTFLPIRIINKLIGYRLLDYLYSKQNIMAIENIIDCEAHRELFSFYLKERRKNK